MDDGLLQSRFTSVPNACLGVALAGTFLPFFFPADVPGAEQGDPHRRLLV